MLTAKTPAATHLHRTYSGGVYPSSVSEGGSYSKGGRVDTYLLFADFFTIAKLYYISRVRFVCFCFRLLRIDDSRHPVLWILELRIRRSETTHPNLNGSEERSRRRSSTDSPILIGCSRTQERVLPRTRFRALFPGLAGSGLCPSLPCIIIFCLQRDINAWNVFISNVHSHVQKWSV